MRKNKKPNNIASDSISKGLTFKEHQTRMMRGNPTFEEWFGVLKKLAPEYGWNQDDKNLLRS